jgi:hypothetical protein
VRRKLGVQRHQSCGNECRRRVLRGQCCWASTRWRSVGAPAPARSSSRADRPVRDRARASLVPVTGAPLPLLHVASVACSCSPRGVRGGGSLRLGRAAW